MLSVTSFTEYLLPMSVSLIVPCHRVVATDIDLARHMNNVAYVRAIVNAFSVKEWKRMDVREMTVIFRAPAHEGDTLQFRMRRDGDVMDVCGRLPGGQTVVLARMRLGR